MAHVDVLDFSNLLLLEDMEGDKLMRDKNMIWAWVIKNSIVIIAWTALAIIFNRWWIALFAILCMTSLETRYKSYKICDKCGKHSPYGDDYNDAADKAREAGWLHIVNGNRDYCPDCRKEYDNG